MSAKRLAAPRNAKLLDLCCGTGLSTEALRTTYPDAEINALDASEGMIEQARTKTELNASWVLGDATDPVAAGVSGPVDGILMAYGIRNIPDADRCLRNVLNLLKPGATVCFHEYSVADSAVSKAVWNAITMGVIIPGGVVTAGNTAIYRYLRKSVLDFDGVKRFEKRLRTVGFRNVRTEPMDGWQRGIVHSFLAERP